MGLALEVGMLAHLKGHDSEGFQHFGDEFRRVGEFLATKGLAPHDEPLELGELQGLSCEMYGYSGLHHLRRLAAYLALEQAIPEAVSSDQLDEEPVVEAYYDALVGGDAPAFQHLMCHSDCEGYYIPQDFAEVLYPNSEYHIAGDMIGSVPRLMNECRELAGALKLPLDLDPDSEEVFNAVENHPGKGEGWKANALEAYICLRLLKACDASLRTMAAIVFV